MGNNQPSHDKFQGEYFDETSFKTLYGGVLITWVTTNVIVDFSGWDDPDMNKRLGLIIALSVAFIGYFLSDNRNLRKLIVTPFNGFLIYLIIMGGTTFLPPPVEIDSVDQRPDQSISEVRPAEYPERRSSFISSWSVDKRLINTTQRLQVENQELEAENTQLIQANRTYEVRLDSARQMIQALPIPLPQQEEIMPLLQFQMNGIIMDGQFQ
jgi:hypothetical protein